MFQAILITSFIVSSLAVHPYYDVEKAEELFEDFVRTYNKTYPNEFEKLKRLDVFKDNLRDINRLNAMGHAVFGVNHFADLTLDEMRQRYMGCEPPEDTIYSTCQEMTDANLTSTNAPDSLDYRGTYVTEVKNQLTCGVCWIFATIGTVEGSYARKYGSLVSLSEEQLMNCLKYSRGCKHGGWPATALSELKTTAGVMRESDYPYDGYDEPCRFEQSRAVARVSDCIKYTLTDENNLKEYLYQNGPIALTLNADTFQTYHRGIFSRDNCPVGSINHAVLLVGYGTENGTDFWIIKNSWGTEFGEEGYIRIERGRNACGILNEGAASAIVA